MRKRRRREHPGCDMDMTPMIDVVFQLIIFFIVTLTINKEVNKEIELEISPAGPKIEDPPPETLVIEVDKTGKISMHNFRLSRIRLKKVMVGRYNRIGEYPVMIRADKETRHRDVKRVMDVCTESGIWRIDFVAIKERVGSD